ncbi:triphosphoribosyl-dephospho-CoA synthase [Xenorhabdus sp. IM139775]|uniref:triphosphoribosyl-dephospho-CoA synthase n=1 Tax=Xenorhabdus sp. IM139775 TaxID=3025876 RepID=UPI00235A1EF9|nr:triphosphoribosyl-dephospho-CoA synthase [Xenorhabdus sp. IM139775]MDC9592757.1 triphosphoribosyl-dephospho-CoA synthase [Xenorhabdus sp. IM139775]
MMYASCLNMQNTNRMVDLLAAKATDALLAEACLTPKPGLVDKRGSGSHHDMDLVLMTRSTESLLPSFRAMALAGWHRPIDITLREEIGRLGRTAEHHMMETTGGVNTHRGAIWAMGLLITALATCGGKARADVVCSLAAQLANIPDSASPKTFSNGLRASHRYHVPGAREEAQLGFPHVLHKALPQLTRSREDGASETAAQINALMAIMSSLGDTCVLSRGGLAALQFVQRGAQAVLAAGGYQHRTGRAKLAQLELRMLEAKISPGGAADLLAATLFLDQLPSINSLIQRTLWNE